MTASKDESLLERLVYSLIEKTDQHYDSMNKKIDCKVDQLEKSVTEELRLLNAEIKEKFKAVEAKAEMQETRISKLEHNWTWLTFCITTISAFLAYILNWLAHFFGINKN